MNRATRGRMARWAALCAVVSACALGGCSSLSHDPGAQEPFILYRVALKDAHLNVVHVQGAVFGVAAKKVALRSISDASGKRCEPISVRAESRGGAALALHGENDTWIVESRGGDFTFEYDVVLTIEDRYSPDVREMITFIGADRCRILGRDVFLVPELPVANGILVDVAMLPGWSLIASSPSVRGRIIVSDLLELPLTLAVSGEYRTLSRSIGESEIVLAIAGAWSFGDEEFFDIVCRIVSEEVALFGSSPRARYLFVCDDNPVKGGGRFDHYGIHYGANMLLLLDRGLDRSELMDTPMAVIAHEFFHNWNGEALQPGGDDFLWFTEGVTVYYSYQVLQKANVITSGQYESRRRAIGERYRDNPYAGTVSIGSAANNDLSDKDMVNLLYDGGFLAAEALDERLRDETGGSVSLIDVLKRMYEGSRTADETSFLRAANELGGKDLSVFLGRLVHTSGPELLERDSSSLE